MMIRHWLTVWRLRVRPRDVLFWAAIVIGWGLLYQFWLREYGAQIISNGNWYLNAARHLFHDGIYSLGDVTSDGALVPTSRFPPVFPAMFAASFVLFGDTTFALEAVRFALFAMAIGTIVYTYRIGCLWSKALGTIAASLAALDVHMLAVAMNYDLPDFAVAFFTTVSSFHFLRALTTKHSFRDLIIAALVLGVAMWTKVVAFLLWVPLVGVLTASYAWRRVVPTRRALAGIGVFLAISAIFFIGWRVRNTYAVGSWSFTSQSGEVLLNYHAGYTLARLRGTPDAVRSLEAELASLRPPDMAADATVAEIDDYRRSVARGILRAHPWTYFVVKLVDIPNLWLGTLPPYYFFPRADVEDIIATINSGVIAGHFPLLRSLWSDGRYGYLAVYASLKGFMGALLAAALIGAVWMARDRSMRWLLATMLLIIAYIMYVSTPVADPRYRPIAMPFVYVLAAYGLHGVRAWVTKRRWVRSVPILHV